MALKTGTKDNAAGNSNADANAKLGADAGSVASPTNFFNILAATGSMTLMTDEATNYVDAVMKLLGTKPRIVYEMLNVGIDKIAAIVIYSQITKNGVVLLFEDSYTNVGSNIPPTEQIQDVYQRMITLAPDMHVCQAICVAPCDYNRKAQMADHINNCILGMDFPGEFRLVLNSFNKSQQFVVNTDPQVVRAEMNRLSPHSIPTRDDIGAVVQLAIPKKKGTLISNDPNDIDLKTVLVMSGYTNINMLASPMFGAQVGVNMPQSNVQFMPTVCLTSIMSAIASPSILGMALCVAAEALIVQNGWVNPYTSLAQDAPNLGNLTIDPKTNKPFNLKPEDVKSFLNSYFCPAFLAIDITDGRARIPGIDNFAFNLDSALEGIAKFTGVPLQVNQAVKLMTKEYIGLATVEGGKTVDTRALDFLKIVKASPDIPRLLPLLNPPVRPDTRLDELRNFYTDIKPMYSNVRVTLAAELVLFIASKLSGVLNINFKGAQPLGTINLASIVQSGGNQFNQSLGCSPFATGWQPGNSQPNFYNF